ncbi:MAG: Trp biosynthesis-associated membrane protein [Streptosporangiaceae bacterium]
MTGGRELLLACAAVGVGSGLVLVAGGQTWVRAVVDLPQPLPPAAYSLTGRDLAPLAWALGLAGLAGLAGVVATRGYARLSIGVILMLVGLAVPVASYLGIGADTVHQALATTAVLVRGGHMAVSTTAWWAAASAGGLLLAGGGLHVALRGRRWPGLSRRYDAPTAPPRPAEDDAAGMWDSLDRGKDPTVL